MDFCCNDAIGYCERQGGCDRRDVHVFVCVNVSLPLIATGRIDFIQRTLGFGGVMSWEMGE